MCRYQGKNIRIGDKVVFSLDSRPERHTYEVIKKTGLGYLVKSLNDGHLVNNCTYIVRADQGAKPVQLRLF